MTQSEASVSCAYPIALHCKIMEAELVGRHALWLYIVTLAQRTNTEVLLRFRCFRHTCAVRYVLLELDLLTHFLECVDLSLLDVCRAMISIS